MKQINKQFSILTIAPFVWIGLTAMVFGQATSITKDEFDKETYQKLLQFSIEQRFPISAARFHL